MLIFKSGKPGTGDFRAYSTASYHVLSHAHVKKLDSETALVRSPQQEEPVLRIT